MKFILLNIQDMKEKVVLETHSIDGNAEIKELLFNEKQLMQNLNLKSNCINKLKIKLFERKIKNILVKALEIKKDFHEKWYYILGDRLVKNVECMKYITNNIELLGGVKYTPCTEMDVNLSKYIAEYLNKNNLKSHEIKLLCVYKNAKNVNFDMLAANIKEYKTINIYLTEKPNSLILDKLSKINREEGTSIEIIKYSKKAFLEYSVIYFADDLRTNYPRMRLEKNSLVIDELEAKRDKYNSNIIIFNSIKDKTKEIDNLKEQYGLLNLAGVVSKIVN